MWKAIERWKDMTRADKDEESTRENKKSRQNTKKHTNILGSRKSLPTPEENQVQDRRILWPVFHYLK
jgi:hypothetical protein